MRLLYPLCVATILCYGLSIRADASELDPSKKEAPATLAAELIDEAELSMEMARDGQYGRIKARDMETLESAYSRMITLLENVDSPSALPATQQQTLALAQSQMAAILRPDDPDRKICKRIAATGTRLGAMECLSLDQRRQRARASRSMVNDAQRGMCNPGEEVSRCSR